MALLITNEKSQTGLASLAFFVPNKMMSEPPTMVGLLLLMPFAILIKCANRGVLMAFMVVLNTFEALCRVA